jgi:hypothetical protein
MLFMLEDTSTDMDVFSAMYREKIIESSPDLTIDYTQAQREWIKAEPLLVPISISQDQNKNWYRGNN